MYGNMKPQHLKWVMLTVAIYLPKFLTEQLGEIENNLVF